MLLNEPPPHLRPENHELARKFVGDEDTAEYLMLGARLGLAWPDIFCRRMEERLAKEIRNDRFRQCLGHYVGQLAKHLGLVVINPSAKVRFAKHFTRGVRYGIS